MDGLGLGHDHEQVVVGEVGGQVGEAQLQGVAGRDAPALLADELVRQLARPAQTRDLVPARGIRGGFLLVVVIEQDLDGFRLTGGRLLRRGGASGSGLRGSGQE